MARSSSGSHHNRYQEFSVRRGTRMSALGIELEKYIHSLLEKLVGEGAISSFQHHAQHSLEDSSGKDFTIMDQGGKEISFGVTISMRSWNEARVRHSKVRQFCFPIGTSPERMRERILSLTK